MTSRAVSMVEPLRRVRENHRAELGVALVHEVGQTVRELGSKASEVAAIGLTNPMITMVAAAAAVAWLHRQTAWKYSWEQVLYSNRPGGWQWEYRKEPVPFLSDADAAALGATIISSTALASLTQAVGGLLPAVLAFLTKGKA